MIGRSASSRTRQPRWSSVLLPPDRGEGQQMNSKPGNLYSRPATVTITVGPVNPGSTDPLT